MSIAPDDKDWTWVLERSCPECGFDASSLSRDAVAPLVRSNASAWRSVLAQPVDRVCTRPRPQRWAPVEYACHVRDVFELFTLRLNMMLRLDHPMFPNWDQDAMAVEEDYLAQEPTVVGIQLTEAALGMASAFDRVTGRTWERRGSRSDGAEFSVDTFSRYMIHDPVHHLYDVRLDLGDLEL